MMYLTGLCIEIVGTELCGADNEDTQLFTDTCCR